MSCTVTSISVNMAPVMTTVVAMRIAFAWLSLPELGNRNYMTYYMTNDAKLSG